MSATYHRNITQGTEEWLMLRCGVITASEIKTILTPPGKTATNDKARAYI